MKDLKYDLISRKCVNSNWTARFLAGEMEEYCQCSFGACKVSVSITYNNHRPYTYILTEEELNAVAVERSEDEQAITKP